jgi:hypothetical protein
MNQEPEQLELTPQNTIRIETALSRFPVHRLAKRGSINIEINESSESDELKTKWEVSYNNKYGQPGALAYKLDTLVINRRIDDERPLIPKIVKLGSLRGIAEELDLGGDTNKIRKALLQNVGALITAKISYKGSDGTERTIEISDTRYGVVFTGDKFPNGSRADAVYIMLHDSYRKVLNDAQTRPLDYDYLKELAPAPQRFYELLSYQIYAALRNERPRAKMLYSYYCTRAPQTRYFDYEHVKKQMYKVHSPHLKSGYLAKVELQEKRSASGEPDWIMLYTPGRRAKAEFREATKPRATQHLKRIHVLPSAATEPEESPVQIGCDTESQELDPLVIKLMSFHVAEATARELVRDYRKAVELQLRALPHRNTNKIKDPASWLVTAIKENYQLPEPIVTALEKEEEFKHAIAKKETERARQQRREALQPAYYDFLRGRAGELRKEQPEAHRAFLVTEAEERSEIENSRLYKPKFRAQLLTSFNEEESHLDRLRNFFEELTFEQWLEQHPDHS